MKRTYPNPFPNGSYFETWNSNNCDKCVKAARIIDELTGRVTKSRCRFQREMVDNWLSDEPVSKETYDIVQTDECPHKQLHWKQYPRKPKFDNQPKLFEV